MHKDLPVGDKEIEKIILHKVLSAFLQLVLIGSREIAPFSESDFQAF